MSNVNTFIAELVRAANAVERLDSVEKRRLLERAVTTIRDMRSQVHRWPSANVRDAVRGLENVAAALGSDAATPEETRTALLDAATMIRDLHIVIDSKTVIRVK